MKNKNVDHKNSLKSGKSVRVEATHKKKKRNEMERHNVADGVLENRWQQSHKHLKMKMKEMEETNEKKNQQVSYIENWMENSQRKIFAKLIRNYKVLYLPIYFVFR